MITELYAAYERANGKICTDTRTLQSGDLFFALKGENFDGNKYAADAINKGASAVVIDNSDFCSQQTILVDDCLKALQNLAHYYRKKNNFNVLALTGTNGKTTTKELIFAVLSQKLKCHATSGNLNNHIGVPLTILSAPIDTEIMVVEMGANHINEIKELCEIAEPNMGLITNIGKAHLEGFGGSDGVKKAKSEMYQFLKSSNGHIFINNEDSTLLELLDNYQKCTPYGTINSSVYTKETGFTDGLVATVNVNNNDIIINTKLFGHYNLINILTAISIGLHFYIKPALIKSAIEAYQPQNNRSQILKTNKNNTVILDSYNANPSSMKAALNSLADLPNNRLVLILGAMKELGDSSKKEHLNLIEQVRVLNPTLCLLIGSEFSATDNQQFELFEDTKQLIDYLSASQIEDSVILVKGSRTNKLETATPYL